MRAKNNVPKDPGAKKKKKAVPAKKSAGAHSKPEGGPCSDLHVLIAKRAHELYVAQGCRHGYDLEDWLEAEREILSQTPQA